MPTSRQQEQAPGKIDVTQHIDALERDLRGRSDEPRTRNALAILLRWQFDHMLTDESRQKARGLVAKYAPPPPWAWPRPR